MTRLIRLACAISATTSSLEVSAFFLEFSTVASIRSAASAADLVVRLMMMSFFTCSVFTASSLAARKRLTIEDRLLTTTSNSRSSASPRSLLKTSFSEASVLPISVTRLASPVAPSFQAAARSAFTLASA